MKYCGTCGSLVAEDATACPVCNGTFFTAQASVDTEQNTSGGFVPPSWGGDAQPQQVDYMNQDVSGVNGALNLEKDVEDAWTEGYNQPVDNNGAWGTGYENDQNMSGGFVAPDTSGTASNPYYVNSGSQMLHGEANWVVNILSFIFPIIGLIFLAFVWTNDKMTYKYDSLVKTVAISMILSTAMSLLCGLFFGFIFTTFAMFG